MSKKLIFTCLLSVVLLASCKNKSEEAVTETVSDPVEEEQTTKEAEVEVKEQQTPETITVEGTTPAETETITEKTKAQNTDTPETPGNMTKGAEKAAITATGQTKASLQETGPYFGNEDKIRDIMKDGTIPADFPQASPGMTKAAYKAQVVAWIKENKKLVDEGKVDQFMAKNDKGN